MDNNHKELQSDNLRKESSIEDNQILINHSLEKSSKGKYEIETYALLPQSLGKSVKSIQNTNLSRIAPLLRQSESIQFPVLESQAKIGSMITPVIEHQKGLSVITNSFKELQTNMGFNNIELVNSAIHSYYRRISFSLTENIIPVLDGFKPSILDTITSFVSSYKLDLLSQMDSPFYHLLETIDFTPLYSIFEQLKGFDFSKHKNKLNKIVIRETYDAKWFPHALCLDDQDMITEFWHIIETTRKSKKRIKQIDRLVYSRYSKKQIETLRKVWRNKNIPNHKLRMMNQAIQAYYRNEYAITVVMLSTLWEGIIYDKTNDHRGKIGKRTKEDFSKLISQTDYDVLFASFFDEYIMYECRSDTDVIEDVPGRNSSAHSWYSKYPSRKAGLNAILFTDFLIKLDPLAEV